MLSIRVLPQKVSSREYAPLLPFAPEPAIGYALLGSLLTWRVGKPLISAHTELRSQEANFRFALVRVSESSEDIALYRGEAAERRFLNSPVAALLATMRRIANRLAALTWVTGGYGWLAILAPLLLAAPGYFGRTLSLGGLMMVVGAFYQVQQALRWYVDRFPAIAEWRAMLTRVIEYRSALAHLDTLGAEAGLIQYDRKRTLRYRSLGHLFDRRPLCLRTQRPHLAKRTAREDHARRTRPDCSDAKIRKNHLSQGPCRIMDVGKRHDSFTVGAAYYVFATSGLRSSLYVTGGPFLPRCGWRLQRRRYQEDARAGPTESVLFCTRCRKAMGQGANPGRTAPPYSWPIAFVPAAMGHSG